MTQFQSTSILAQRVLTAKPSATKEMTRLARQLTRAGTQVIALSQGEPDFPTPAHICAAAKHAIDQGGTRYTEVAGTLELRVAIVHKFQRDNTLVFTPEQIQVGCGAKQVLYNAFQATLDPGDEVIVPMPAWVSYPEMILLAGGCPVAVPCTAEAGFKLTPDQLDSAITPRTKWLLLNSPSNPSGAIYTDKELIALGEVLVRHPKVWIMSDDIYEKIRYIDAPFATFASVVPSLAERTLTVNGVSKTYAMTGWRVGYGAGPAELVKAMNLVQSQATSHTSSISQAAAVAALDGPYDFLPGFVAAFRRRRDKVVTGLNAIEGLHCNAPAGTFYAFPSCHRLVGRRAPDDTLIADDNDLALYLLRAARVAVVPGSAFGYSGYFRVSYATADQEIEDALARIATACSKLV